MKSLVRSLAASLLVVSVLYGAAACSSGDAGSVAGDKESFISQLCNEYMPCCGKAGKPTDGAQCRAVYTALTGSAGTYDAAAAGKCLDEVRANAKSATFCEDGMSSSSAPSCRGVFGGSGGTKKPGETCNDDDECAPSSEGEAQCASLYKDGTTIKKCQIQVHGKVGDTPCAGTVNGNVTSYSGSGTPATDVPQKAYLCYVKEGLYCDGASSQCKAIGKLGEACSNSGSYSCTSDAYCDISTKQCVARKAVGAACEVYSNQCAEGSYCNSTTKVCTTAIANGAVCKTNQECLSERCVNGKCEASSDLSTSFLCGG